MSNDLVLQGLFSSIFWVTIATIVVVAFRQELRGLIRSLTAVKVAGASFTLGDRGSTLESYAVLANILIEILSQREAAPKVRELMSRASGQQLAQFLVKYEREVPEDERNLEFMKNAARIVGWTGHHDLAIKFLDRLLKKHPNDFDLLVLKANQLNDTNLTDYLMKAKKEFENLLDRDRNNPWVRFRYAINLSKLGEYEKSVTELERLEIEFWRRQPRALEDRHLGPALRLATQDRVAALRNKISASVDTRAEKV